MLCEESVGVKGLNLPLIDDVIGNDGCGEIGEKEIEVFDVKHCCPCQRLWLKVAIIVVFHSLCLHHCPEL